MSLKYGISVLAISSAIAMSANAQEAPKDEGVETVIVTAQKRSERIQDVPISISALSSGSLSQKGVTNIAKVSDFTPGIQIDKASGFAGSPSIISAFIRGIGQSDFAFNMEPGVGLYVDGVYYARTVGAAVDLTDVERVEVLKGPQGTLFGRNTIGGALSIITKEPANEYYFSGSVTTGSYNRLDVKGMVNIPLIDDKLAMSVSFSSNEQDGYQKRVNYIQDNGGSVTVTNPTTGTSGTYTQVVSDTASYLTAKPVGGSDTQGGENNKSLRVKLKYTPNDKLKILISGDYTRADEEATPYTLLSAVTNGTTLGDVYNLCIVGLDVAGMCNRGGAVSTNLTGDTSRIPWGNHFKTNDIDKSYATGSNYSDVTVWGASSTIDYNINDNLSLKSITAYRNLDSAFGVDVDGTPLMVIDTSFTMDQEQFSEELQANINAFDDRLKSVVGAYYFKETGGLVDTVTFMEGLVEIYGPNDFTNNAWAIFTHNNFKLTDKLGLTFGVRYTEEKKTFVGSQSVGVRADTNGDNVTENLGFIQIFPTSTFRKNFENTSVRIGGEYKFTKDVMAFASFAQGYKSGGWTTRLGAPLSTTTQLNPDPTQPPSHRPEKADTYEIGIKSHILNKKLRLNATAFSSDYKDMQLTITLPQTGNAPWFINSGEARIKGFEIESDAKITPNFLLNAGISYLDAKYNKLDAVALLAGFTLNHKLANTPEWSGTLGGTYTLPLESGAYVQLHADYNYKSEMAKDALNLYVEDSVSLYNANVTYNSKDSKYAITFGAENIGDKRFVVASNFNGGVGSYSAMYNKPRTWFLTLKFRS